VFWVSSGYEIIGLPVLAVEQKLQRKLRVLIGGFDVPASVVVADDFAVPLEHQLGNASAVDAPLGTFVVLLHPVVKNLAVYLDAAFFPHNRVDKL
jgi:hypothetical protein